MFSFDSRVRFSEVDINGDLTLIGVVNYLQDCVSFHGREVNLDINWTKKTGKTWVLANMQIHVVKYPSFGTRITVKTWPVAFRGYIGTRQYSICDEDGNVLVMANTEWVFMNLAEGKPIQADEEQINAYEPYMAPLMDHDFGKRKIRKPKEVEKKETFFVTANQLDTNHHVNNGQYILMAKQYLPADMIIRKMRVEYKKQALLSDEIYPEVAVQDGVYTVVLKDQKDNIFFIGEFSDQEIA